MRESTQNPVPRQRKDAAAGPAPGASALVGVDVSALSHPGKVRANNEDHYIVARFDRGMQMLLSNLPPGDLPTHYAETAWGLLVADGVGGSAGGEIASRTAVQALVDLAIETPDWIMRLDDALSVEVQQRMERRFQKIREILAERARQDPKLRGMATTLSVACTIGAQLLTVHVGDSRIYVCRDGKLTRLTRDQTMAQSLVDAGAIKPEEVATHPGHHILTSALAARGFVQVDHGRASLRDGDRLLLCSDGLTDMVSEEAIARVLGRGPTSEAACRALVDLALEGGGRDNVTVVVAHYRIPAAG